MAREFTPMPPPSLLEQHIAQAIAAANGWIGFDQFMQLALYQPGLGYYSGGLPKIGTMPEGGSDFVTAPEMSPLFGEVLAVQVAQVGVEQGQRLLAKADPVPRWGRLGWGPHRLPDQPG